MSDVTDEAVEIAAKAIAKAVGLEPDECAMGTGSSDGDTTCILRMWELYRCHARAALEAALPLLVGGERWRPIATAPKDWTPVLVRLPAKAVRNRDGQHGVAQVAAFRGRGWISIPGMWECAPTHWAPIPAIRADTGGGTET